MRDAPKPKVESIPQCGVCGREVKKAQGVVMQVVYCDGLSTIVTPNKKQGLPIQPMIQCNLPLCTICATEFGRKTIQFLKSLGIGSANSKGGDVVEKEGEQNGARIVGG